MKNVAFQSKLFQVEIHSSGEPDEWQSQSRFKLSPNINVENKLLLINLRQYNWLMKSMVSESGLT